MYPIRRSFKDHAETAGKYLGLDELERRTLSHASAITEANVERRLRTLGDITEQAAGESSRGDQGQRHVCSCGTPI